MATKISRIVSFSNVDEVFERMSELGFFESAEAQAEAKELIASQHETILGNDTIKLKVFRGLFGAYELCNYYEHDDSELESIFAVAALSRG